MAVIVPHDDAGITQHPRAGRRGDDLMHPRPLEAPKTVVVPQPEPVILRHHLVGRRPVDDATREAVHLAGFRHCPQLFRTH